jgi:hypothetical protein
MKMKTITHAQPTQPRFSLQLRSTPDTPLDEPTPILFLRLRKPLPIEVRLPLKGFVRTSSHS